MAVAVKYLDGLIYGVRRILFGGATLPERSTLEIAGSGVTVTDDPENGRTKLSIAVDPQWRSVPIVAGKYETALGVWTSIGAREIDASLFNGEDLVFTATAYASPGLTARVRLFNLTDNEAASSTLSTTATSPARLEVAVSLPSAPRMYEVQVLLFGDPDETDRAYVTYSGLEVQG